MVPSLFWKHAMPSGLGGVCNPSDITSPFLATILYSKKSGKLNNLSGSFLRLLSDLYFCAAFKGINDSAIKAMPVFEEFFIKFRLSMFLKFS